MQKFYFYIKSKTMPDTTKNLDPIGFRYKQTSETNELIDIYLYFTLRCILEKYNIPKDGPIV